MDLLLLVLFIGFSIWSSANKSKTAKNQREERMRGMGKPSESVTELRGQRKTASQEANARRAAQQATKEKRYAESRKAAPKQRQTESRKEQKGLSPKHAEFNWRELFQPKQEKRESAQKLTKSASETRKTLIEQKPDCERERQRTAHEKVSASVKPLRNIYDNDENCEHRIELNPNISYQHVHEAKNEQKMISVKTDADSLLQGVIWSEILGKPKAYQARGGARR